MPPHKVIDFERPELPDLSKPDSRYCKIDFTQAECESIVTLADAFDDLIVSFGHRFSKQNTERMRTIMKGVKFKANTAAMLFIQTPIIQ